MIKTWQQRCEEHPDHQQGIVTQQMIQDRMQEEIDELRQALAQPEQDELLKQGWRQCAIGQRTTQYCGMAEQARKEEREVCLKEIAIELDEWGWGNNANIALNNVYAAIQGYAIDKARSEK